MVGVVFTALCLSLFRAIPFVYVPLGGERILKSTCGVGLCQLKKWVGWKNEEITSHIYLEKGRKNVGEGFSICRGGVQRMFTRRVTIKNGIALIIMCPV